MARVKRYFQIADENYILMFGIGAMGDAITKTRYNSIMQALAAKPEDTDDIYYRLRLDLTWEACYRPEPTPDPEPDPIENI